MTAHVLRADARQLPLPDGSVDLVVTSPPYFGLRSYQDGGEHYSGQIGDEPTPAEFVDALLDVTRECVRVLKPAGSLWVNLGDKYGGFKSNPGTKTGLAGIGKAYHTQDRGAHGTIPGTMPKSLLGIPWRYALRCIDDLGLILRAEVIWSKPNGLPESVTDRVRRSHEQWFHLVRQPRYFSAVDEIREGTHRVGLTWEQRKTTGARTHSPDNGHMSGGPGMAANPLGKLPGSVWTIPTQPLTVPAHLGVDHFAAFPMEFPRRIIRGWSPAGVCVECGEGRRPVVVKGPQPVEPAHRGATRLAPGEAGNGTLGFRASKLSGQEWNAFRAANPDTITGYACDCPTPDAPTRPAVVLDPFGGTGTTALVASALGRVGISVDRSADYCRLARWRTTDPGQRAAAMQVEKPPAQLDGQLGMFEETA